MENNELCLDEFINLVSEGIYIHDRYGIFINVNNIICSRLGYSKEELIGKHISFIDLNFNKQNDPENHWKNTPAKFETRHKHKNTRIINVEVSLTSFNFNGQDLYIGFATDITERKKAEVVLKESESHYKKLFLESPSGYISLDINGNILDVNPSWTKIFGYTRNDVTGKKLTKFILKNSRDELNKYLASIKHHDNIKSIQISARRSDNTEVIISVNGTVSYFLDGSFYCYHLMLNDITETVKSKEQTIKYYQTIINSPTPIAITDVNDNFEFVNPEFCKLTGYSEKELLNNHTSLLWSKTNNHKFYDDLRKKIQSGKTWEGETCNKRKDGSLFWEFLTIIPVKNEAQEVSNYIHISQNITDFKKIEKDLVDAKEKAITENDLKTAFIANLSHDIRTPLNVIVGFSELLSNASLKQEKRDYFSQIIKQNCNDLLHLINDIVDVSKIETNKLLLQKEEFQPYLMCKELKAVYEMSKKDLDKSNIVLKLDIPANLKNISVESDSSRIRQIITNLLNNSLKFTHQGNITFGYNLINNNAIEFFVKDTGIGIPKNRQSAIFERYIQASSDVELKYGGTGLGLAICKGLVKLMGGNIFLKSKENSGTEIRFSIPVKLINYISDHPVDLKQNTKESEQLLKNKTILIVEDITINYEYIYNVLSDYKPDILWAKNGDEAIRLFKENKVTLVLLDIKLPEKDGYQVLKEIKSINSDVPVIAQTAYAMTEEISTMQSNGFDHVLLKPINSEDLIRVIFKYS